MVDVHPYVIIELVRTAYYCKHSVAAEVALRVKRARDGYEAAATTTVRSQAQADVIKRRMDSAKETLAALEDLQKSLASCRGECGALPVFKDKAPCEPSIARWAERLRAEVELAADGGDR